MLGEGRSVEGGGGEKEEHKQNGDEEQKGTNGDKEQKKTNCDKENTTYDPPLPPSDS